MSVSIYRCGMNRHFFMGQLRKGRDMTMNSKKAYLLLANGQIFEGKSFGAEGTTIGEVVFTTGMVGYLETLTDPGYAGQIVIQTFPLNGNYGVNEADRVSDKCWLKGYIVREWCEVPSNFRCNGTIDEFLKKENVIALYDIDTRALTRVIREQGVMNGVITTEDVYSKKDEFLAQLEANQAAKAVTTAELKEYPAENGKYNVVMVDYGERATVIKQLNAKNCNVKVVPAEMPAEEILALNPDGILLSNGPGNPHEDAERLAQVAKLLESKKPIFGIGLGHQLVALAKGAKVEKHKYGHRGGNQPVKDANSSRIYSQNHGYIVLADSLDEKVAKVSYYNVNDNTCEGLVYEEIPVFTVQFYPATSGGPLNTMFLFDQFTALMDKEGK